MNDSVYRQWWQLHVRAARGDPLAPEERDVYDAGRRELDQTETLQPIERAKEAREELRGLELERSRLEQRRQELDAEIAALEGRLSRPTRQLLGAEE